MKRTTLASIVAPTVASSAYVLEIALFPIAMPGLERVFGLARGDLVLLANVYGIAVAGAVLLGGWLGGRLGAMRVFVAGLVCFTLGGAIVALAGDLSSLLVGRLVQGIGGGLLSPSIPVLLTRASAGRPGRALALWNALSGFIVALAPLAGVPLVAEFGWQAIFVLISAVALAAIGLAVAGRPSGGPDPAAGPDGVGPAAAPVPRRWRWGLPGRPALFAYVGFNYGTILLFLFVVPLHLNERGQDAALGAAVLGLFWASFTTVGLTLRNRFDGPLVGGFLAASPILLMVGFLAFFAEGAPVLMPCLAALIVGAGFALGNAPSTVLILRHAPDGQETLAASLDITAARLGSVAIIGMIGAWGPEAMRLGVLGVSLLGLACALPFVRASRGPLPRGERIGRTG